jgi:subtilisin-like proprotein convertase family protein
MSYPPNCGWQVNEIRTEVEMISAHDSRVEGRNDVSPSMLGCAVRFAWIAGVGRMNALRGIACVVAFLAIVAIGRVHGQGTHIPNADRLTFVVADGFEPPKAPSKPQGFSEHAQALGSANSDPHQTAATARPLGTEVYNAVKLKAAISRGVQGHYYSFDGQAGDRVFAATLTALNELNRDTAIDVLDADGATVLETDDDDGTFSPLSSSIAGMTLREAGTYYIRVRNAGPAYQRLPYELFVRVLRGDAAAETEPNSDPASANLLPNNAAIQGLLALHDDIDVFSIALNAGDTIWLSLDTNPLRDVASPPAQLGFGQFDGSIFLAANDAGHDGPDSESLFMTVQHSGTYYVAVSGAGGGIAGDPRPYILSAAVFPRACSGSSQLAFLSVDVPKVISGASNSGITTSTLIVPGNPRIGALRVKLQLTHNNLSDLDVHLISPAGNDNALFTSVPSSAFSNMELILDDDAALPVTSFPLFSGMECRPEPEYRLNWFAGEHAGGTWTLVIEDKSNADDGELLGWSLEICEAPLHLPPAGMVPITVFQADFDGSESPAAGFTHSGMNDEWELGAPNFVPIGSPPGACSGAHAWVTNLDGPYAAGSSQSLLSPVISLAHATAPIIVRWAQKHQLGSCETDRSFVEVREVGGGNALGAMRLWEWDGPAMVTIVGSGAAELQQSAGWAFMEADISAFAGRDVQLRFHLESAGD